MNTNILKDLCEINAVATQEDKVKNYIKPLIEAYVDEMYEDNFGNLIAHKKGNGDKLLLSAHTDQIGFMITDISPDGTLQFASVGGLIPFTLIGQRVVINDEIIGCINVSIDFEKGGDLKGLGPHSLFIDIGCKDKSSAEEKVAVGDFGNFHSEYFENDEIIMSKAMDDRIGCFALIEVIQKIKDSKYDCYFVFSSQEETGTRGAYTAAYSIMPKFGISLDITPAGDMPGTKNSTSKLGQGVGIKLMDPGLIINPELKDILTQLAEKHDIPYQYEVMKRGGTDAGAFQSIGQGVKSAALSIPTRHAHTSNEIVSKLDVQAMIDLLSYLLEA